MSRGRQHALLLPLASAALALTLSGCGSAVRTIARPFYVPATIDQTQAEVRLDVAYRGDPGADGSKHRLDLLLPAERGWPLMVFVHGGSLEKGDTDQRIAGQDIYRNIGRFYAARGVGVALVNYRLQPGVNWRDQVEDVATATAWLVGRARELGGDGRVYLVGHSAGSWLAAHVALDERLKRRHGIAPRDLTGVISVSGSGFDLTDDRTWEMFGRQKKWQRRFSLSPDDPDWKEQASVVPLIGAGAPPFLLLYSSREWPALARQNRLFCEALVAAHGQCEVEELEGYGHRRMVLALSHADRDVSRRVLRELTGANSALDGERRGATATGPHGGTLGGK